MGKCSFLLSAGPQSLGWGGPRVQGWGCQHAALDAQPRLTAPRVSLVTLGSCCLGFPTRWAEIGLLAEAARVLP